MEDATVNWRELLIPGHFDPDTVGQVWRVPYGERAGQAAAWARQHGIAPAAADEKRVCLLAIDVQNTFCLPDFELFVGGRSGRGAIEDNARLCDFVYRNLASITEIHPTLDTHTAMQIFHPVFLVNAAGEHPQPMTPVSLEDVENGVWRVNPAVGDSVAGGDVDALQQHLLYYCRKLNDSGKYMLMIWPYHSILGGIGHCLVSAVEEALFFHSLARHSQTGFEIKGGNPLTENYSVLRPEVLDSPDGQPIAQKNDRLANKLLEFDMLIIAGQAKSHCVAWTVADLLDDIEALDPALARKVYLLEDCTSPVVVPGVIDFTDDADAAYRRFADAGMHRVQSTTAMADWPDLSQ